MQRKGSHGIYKADAQCLNLMDDQTGSGVRGHSDPVTWIRGGPQRWHVLPEIQLVSVKAGTWNYPHFLILSSKVFVPTPIHLMLNSCWGWPHRQGTLPMCFVGSDDTPSSNIGTWMCVLLPTGCLGQREPWLYSTLPRPVPAPDPP